MPPSIQVWTLVSFFALFIITLILLHLIGRVNNVSGSGIRKLSERIEAIEEKAEDISGKLTHDSTVLGQHEGRFKEVIEVTKTLRDMLSTHSSLTALSGNRLNTLENQYKALLEANAAWDERLKSSKLDKEAFTHQLVARVREVFDEKMKEINQQPEEVVGPVIMHKFLNTPDLGANDAVTLADLKNFVFKREKNITSLELPITTAIRASDAVVKAADDEATIVVGAHALTPAQAVLVANLIYEWVNNGRIVPGRSAGDADPTLHPNQAVHPDLQKDLAAVQAREAEEADEQEEDEEDDEDEDEDEDGIELENLGEEEEQQPVEGSTLYSHRTEFHRAPNYILVKVLNLPLETI